MKPDETASKGRRVWLRAFYGFNPEEAGYLGFTYEAQREDMLSKMNDGDLVLIYGAVDSLTQTDLRRQALGFMEVKLERCRDTDRQNDASLAWKIEHGFENRWIFGLRVVRAWRVRNRVHIKHIAPKAYDNKNRFERTTKAILLEPDEKIRALSHPVYQVNVYGEASITEDELAQGAMNELLRPSSGIRPSFGPRTSHHEDGQNHLYLIMLNAKAEALLGATGPHVGRVLVKVGRSNDPSRRLKEINEGFPKRAVCRWELKHNQPFENGATAHAYESEIKNRFADKFNSLGNEFFYGDGDAMELAFLSYCFSRMPKILAAPGNATGTR